MTLLDPVTTTESRTRILTAAYRLFSTPNAEVTFEDVARASDVPVDEIQRRFPEISVLVAAALEHASHQWAMDAADATVRSGARTAEERLLALFAVYEEWFGREDFDAAGLMTMLGRSGRIEREGRRMLLHVERMRRMLATLAAEEGLGDPDDFALSFHVLLKGAVISAIEGDGAAIQRARGLAKTLIAVHRPAGEARRDRVRLAPGGDEREWLVLSETAAARGENAVALVRQESQGYCCYPNVVGFGRLGPYESLEEAYEAVVSRVAPPARVK